MNGSSQSPINKKRERKKKLLNCVSIRLHCFYGRQNVEKGLLCQGRTKRSRNPVALKDSALPPALQGTTELLVGIKNAINFPLNRAMPFGVCFFCKEVKYVLLLPLLSTEIQCGLRVVCAQ